MLEENMEENVNAFFCHLGVRNSLLRTQNKETMENSDIFYYAKMKKKHYFCTGKFIRSKVKKSTGLKTFHTTRYYLVEKNHRKFGFRKLSLLLPLKWDECSSFVSKFSKDWMIIFFSSENLVSLNKDCPSTGHFYNCNQMKIISLRILILQFSLLKYTKLQTTSIWEEDPRRKAVIHTASMIYFILFKKQEAL